MKIIYISSLISKSKMKYILDNSNEKPLQSIQRYHRLICEGLVDNDCAVSTISAIPVSNKISSKKFWKAETEEDNGVVYQYLPFINIFIIRHLLLFIFSFLYSIREILKNRDVVFVCDVLNTSISIAALFACKLFGVECTGIVTDMPSDMKESKKISIMLNNIFLHSYDKYIFLTKYMNERVNTKNKSYEIIEGICDEVNYHKVKKSNYIMYAGGLYERYGIKYLIDGFNEAKIPNVKLKLFGSGDLVEEIKNIKNSNIVYGGVVNNDKILKCEKEALLLVNPRFSNEEYTKYSFPSKNIEYMSSGTPVLTTRLPGIPDEYFNYVYLIEEETKSGIKDKLNEIFNKSKDELKQFGNKAKDYVIKNKNKSSQSKKIKSLLSLKSDKKSRFQISLFTIIFSTVLMLIGFFSKNVDLCKFSLLFCLFSISLKSVFNLKKYLILLVFLISFFTFGLGQYLFSNVTYDTLYYKNFESGYVVTTMLIQFLSLIFVYFGYELISFYIKNSKRTRSVNKENIEIKDKALFFFKKFINFFLILTFFASIIVKFEKFIFVMNNSYLELYTDAFNSIFPFIIIKLASYYIVFFMLFLSIEKSRKRILVALVLFVINNFVDLLSGSRFMFVFSMFFLLFYIGININKSQLHLLFKKKKIIFICIIILPVFVIFLNSYNSIRNGIFKFQINPLHQIESFFVSQGRSANIITYSQIYEDELKKGNPNYVFGWFINPMYDKIEKISFGLIKPNNNVETNFGLVISKLILGEESVKEGNGVGSNYLAELYINYGLIGIVIFNLLIGLLIGFFYFKRNDGFIYKFFCLTLISPLLHIHRSITFEIMAYFLSATVIALLLIYVFIYIVLKRYNRRIKHENSLDC